ncbi:MAG: tRNA lysidine(34) synthetase TilS [Endomicrobium sp.]|jgi:tRNA(Ile)-lysidine synthase|nr:tRNA lysidine(34) synthetase TilS [Endomicrobium sp.]
MKAWEGFYKNIKSEGLIKSGDAVLLAVSGGKDSISMAHLFWRLSKKVPLKLYIVYFDHALRKESKRDGKTVKILSDKLNVPCKTIELEVKKYARQKRISIETAGRNLRYENLLSFAKKLKCNKIATAHNSNDNAETVLMQLLRGSGNLTGIPLRREIDKKIEIIRPLLCVKRKDIEQYINEQNLPFCTDKSNFSLDYTRNKVRLILMPELEKINPRVLEHISSLSAIQAREDAFLEERADEILKKCAKIGKNRILLDLSTFLLYNKTLCFRALKNLLPDKKYAAQINFIMDEISSQNDFTHAISANWTVKIKNKKAFFMRRNANANDI